MKQSEYMTMVTGNLRESKKINIETALEDNKDSTGNIRAAFSGTYPYFLKVRKKIGDQTGYHLYTNRSFNDRLEVKNIKVGQQNLKSVSVPRGAAGSGVETLFITAGSVGAGRETNAGGLAFTSSLPWQLARGKATVGMFDKQVENYNKFANAYRGGEMLDEGDINPYSVIDAALKAHGESLAFEFFDLQTYFQGYAEKKRGPRDVPTGLTTHVSTASNGAGLFSITVGGSALPISPEGEFGKLSQKFRMSLPKFSFTFQRTNPREANPASSTFLIPIADENGFGSDAAVKNTELLKDLASSEGQNPNSYKLLQDLAITDPEGKLGSAKERYITSGSFTPETLPLMRKINRMIHEVADGALATDVQLPANNRKHVRHNAGLVLGEWKEVLEQQAAKFKDRSVSVVVPLYKKVKKTTGAALIALAQFTAAERGDDVPSISMDNSVDQVMGTLRKSVKGYKVVDLRKGNAVKRLITKSGWVDDLKKVWGRGEGGLGWKVHDVYDLDHHLLFDEEDAKIFKNQKFEYSLDLQAMDPVKLYRVAGEDGLISDLASIGVNSAGAVEKFLGPGASESKRSERFSRFVGGFFGGLSERTPSGVERQRRMEDLLFGEERTPALSTEEVGDLDLSGIVSKRLKDDPSLHKQAEAYAGVGDSLVNAFADFKTTLSDHASFLHALTAKKGILVSEVGKAAGSYIVKFDAKGRLYKVVGDSKQYIPPRVFDLGSPYMVALAGMQAICTSGAMGSRGVVNGGVADEFYSKFSFEHAFLDEEAHSREFEGKKFGEWAAQFREKVISTLTATRQKDDSLAESLEALAILPDFMALQRSNRTAFAGLFSRITVGDFNLLGMSPDVRALHEVAVDSITGFDKVQKYLQLRGAQMSADPKNMHENTHKLLEDLTVISDRIKKAEAGLITALKGAGTDRAAVIKKIDRARQDYGDDWMSDTSSWVWNTLISPITSTFSEYIDYFLTAGWRVVKIAADLPGFLTDKVAPAFWESLVPAAMLFLRSFTDRMVREIFYDGDGHNLSAVRKRVHDVLDDSYGFRGMSAQERSHFEKLAFSGIKDQAEASSYGSYIHARYGAPLFLYEGDKNIVIDTSTARYDAVITRGRKPSNTSFSVVAELKETPLTRAVAAEIAALDSPINGVTVFGSEYPGSSNRYSQNLKDFYDHYGRALTPDQILASTADRRFQNSVKFHGRESRPPKSVSFFGHGGKTFVRTTFNYADAFGSDSRVGELLYKQMSEKERRRKEREGGLGESDRRLPAVRKLFQMLAV